MNSHRRLTDLVPEKSDAPVRAALYMRVSTGRQAEHDLSIPDQRSQLQSWCRGNGHPVVAEYVEAAASRSGRGGNGTAHLQVAPSRGRQLGRAWCEGNRQMDECSRVPDTQGQELRSWPTPQAADQHRLYRSMEVQPDLVKNTQEKS